MNLTFITTMAGNAWGGSEELWVKLAHDALNEGHRVECSVFDWVHLPSKLKILKQSGVHIKKRTRFMYSEFYKKPFGKLKEITIAKKQLTRHLKDNEFALVSMGGFSDLEVVAFRNPLLQTKASFSLVVHANPEEKYFNAESIPEIIKVCSKAHKVYFVSNRLKEIAIRQTGYSFPNGDLIINPVNMAETGILPFPETLTIQMACVGRLNVKVKGQAILLQCLSDPNWSQRNWHLNIYGEGDDLNYLILLAKKFNIENKVTFHGHVNDIRSDIWRHNHILIMPSYYEGMPIALVEAMLSGRTAVVTDVGGNAELLQDNSSGFISKGVNKGSFQEALERAWEKKASWNKMGEIAFNHAQDYINKISCTRNINDILP